MHKRLATDFDRRLVAKVFYGRPWPAVYINFVLKIHQIQVLTEPLCRAQASFYALPNNERGTKYRGLTYSASESVGKLVFEFDLLA